MTTDISASAMSLAQYANMSNDPLVQSISYSLIDMGNVMGDMQFLNQETLIANGVRWEGNLPTVNWGALNSDPVTTIGTPTPYQEQAYILRNAIDTDKFLVQDKNQITNPRSAQLAAYLKSATYDFNYKFIKNDHVTGDANSFVGLRYRLDNPLTYGVWNNGSTANGKIDAGGVDLSTAGLTASTANAFLEYLDQLIWSVDGGTAGDGVCLYMNEVMQRRIDRALRAMGTSGGLTITKDQFDRTITAYKGAQIRDIGYKADQVTRIITTTETANGKNDTGGTFTSIYAVKHDTDHLFGWQFEPIKGTDLGLMNNGVIYRTLIDWAGGIMSANLRSFGRLYDIKLA